MCGFCIERTPENPVRIGVGGGGNSVTGGVVRQFGVGGGVCVLTVVRALRGGCVL